MSGEYHWRTDRKLKILKNTDVLVVGAGLGGICAALSAAKAGCSVVLVEKNAVLGGQAAEIDTWGWMDLSAGKGTWWWEVIPGNFYGKL